MIGIYELAVLIFLLLIFLPFIIAFIDILKSDFSGNNKIVWLLAVIFVPFIGAIAYLIIGRKQKINTSGFAKR
ncbi:MAG TPA: PLD nuclease N-terminal domain-containing protein [Smithellaceae bacterium]|nr:PLD nuclease N-terminal domain-containing protein [Smithellaceae bacterium]HRS88359.1 PLD nuclease N-terminal domain-containing protein [Smithellaceae bacterium]HRV25004.1 PLD nuclease N-terminal domain-containing protein [Smithellaceae bacterium]